MLCSGIEHSMKSFRFELHKITQLRLVLPYGSLKTQIKSHRALLLNKARLPKFYLFTN